MRASSLGSPTITEASPSSEVEGSLAHSLRATLVLAARTPP